MKKFITLLNEAVMPNVVNDAIDNKYQVIITYSDEENHAPLTRLIEPYAYGKTKAGNDCIRAYQYNGDTYRGIPKWKLFRLDRITSWKPTKRHFNVEPKENGWPAEDYNNEGDNTMSIVINQVKFDKYDDSFSPNDTLNKLRRQTDNIRKSTPIKVDQMQQNNSGPVDNKSTEEFKKMLSRNLDITRKEKEKRGFRLSNDNNINEPQNVDSKVVEPENSVQQVETPKTDFQSMLDRNLAITRKEKDKRGFDINKQNKGPVINNTIRQTMNNDIKKK